jgi:hypothetical protein
MRNKRIGILVALYITSSLSTFKLYDPVSGQKPDNGHPRSAKKAPRKQNAK